MNWLTLSPPYDQPDELEPELREAAGFDPSQDRDESGKWSGGASDPFAGEMPGVHTPAAQAKLISYLERETGEKFKPHGSTSKGITSPNDIDIIKPDPTHGMPKEEAEAYWQKLSDEANRAEAEAWDRIQQGKGTLADLYDDYDPAPGTLEHAMHKIGFERNGSVAWLGITVTSYRHPVTGHNIDIWEPASDPYLYGLAGFDPNQDRDEGGRWTTGGFVPASAERRKELGLPPAWKDVVVNPNPNGRLQAVGIDAKGRRQYRYSAEHTEAVTIQKFARMKAFNEALPDLRSQIEKDLESANAGDREAAAVVALIDRTGFRVGTDEDTGADVQAFGATTLQVEHVSVTGDKVHFEFTGKKGVKIEKDLEDATLARELKLRLKGKAKDDSLFETTDDKVRDYIRERAPGFTPKDFRTRHATALALDLVKSLPKPTSISEFKASRRLVGDRVAEFLGNTRTVALTSYVDPSVFAAWESR